MDYKLLTGKNLVGYCIDINIFNETLIFLLNLPYLSPL